MKRMGVAGIALVVAFLTMVGAASAKRFTQTFKFADQEQTFTVPRGVFVLHVVAVGARGGGEISGSYGAQVSGDLSVRPGETLYVEVGGDGGSPVDPGFNGGGVLHGPSCCSGDSGGGASDVRTAPLSAGLSPDDRLIVAGGGGGSPRGGSAGKAGGNGVEYGRERCFEEKEAAERRGEEWNLEEHEAACRIEGFNEGGGPGTASRGGTGGGFTVGPGNRFGQEGRLGEGGAGGFPASGNCDGHCSSGGGGGGGGYYGGGGGAARSVVLKSQDAEPWVWTGYSGGGGGGSSLVPPGGREEGTAYPSEVQIGWSRGRHRHPR